MTITTWNPWRELDVLRREVERAFTDYAPDLHDWRRKPWASLLPAFARSYPPLNMSEDHDTIFVEALAPGLDPGSIEVAVERGTLRISGEKPGISPDIKPEAYHRNERGAGRFTRTLSLPAEVEGDEVKAEYTNGILLVTLPKAETAKPKKITVNVS